MAKQIKYGEEAREKLKSGVDQLTRAVATTLGPKGRNIALDKKWGAPNVVHDGVTVAKEIELKDPFENMGAQLIKEAASKTADVAGDGTTTATVLARAIISEGIKNITAGSNPMIMRKGLERASGYVVNELKSMSKKVKDADIENVATVSAGSSELGELIASAMEKVGKDGVITVEESQTLGTQLEVVEGLQFDKGYISPYMVTDPERMEAVLEDPYILNANQKITAVADLVPLLEKVMQAGRPMLIIAEDVEGEALATIVVNKIRGTFTCVAVKAPGFGDRRKAMIEDIAVVTGGQVITEELGIKLENVTLEMLGRASKIKITKEDTTIVEGKGDPEAIKGRIKQIKNEIDGSDSEFDREKLQERLAKLSGGVAVIKVGAATETELKEKKHRIEDALSATKAAVEEGIVAGGGAVLINIIEAVGKDNLTGDEKTGAEIVQRSLEEPLRQLAYNAGYEGSVVVEKVKGLGNGTALDVLSGDYKDMFKAGIIDPAKVTRSALQNAASIASMILTTEAIVAEKPEDEKSPMPGGMPPGMM